MTFSALVVLLLVGAWLAIPTFGIWLIDCDTYYELLIDTATWSSKDSGNVASFLFVVFIIILLGGLSLTIDTNFPLVNLFQVSNLYIPNLGLLFFFRDRLSVVAGKQRLPGLRQLRRGPVQV